jgi:SAM-dependent methyltransferase
MKWEQQYVEFESFVISQLPAKPSRDFDGEYFTGEWRHGYTTYTLETRRKVEGKNPELIKSILNPKKLLDVGCGPGLLVLMLREIDVEARGFDASDFALNTAPEQVKPFLSKGDILNIPFGEGDFDVLVCREVLEHLTVLQVARAISEMCRVSSNLIYVTTRYAHECKSIFDVETEFEADPTHITCMNKTLLRTLFLLNGFKSRPDLETKLDWLDKGRVLVYEKIENFES